MLTTDIYNGISQTWRWEGNWLRISHYISVVGMGRKLVKDYIFVVGMGRKLVWDIPCLPYICKVIVKESFYDNCDKLNINQN
jgi:hypothetical protein